LAEICDGAFCPYIEGNPLSIARTIGSCELPEPFVNSGALFMTPQVMIIEIEAPEPQRRLKLAGASCLNCIHEFSH